jgi:hypothetical protein
MRTVTARSSALMHRGNERGIRHDASPHPYPLLNSIERPMLQINHDSSAHRLSAELEGYSGFLEYALDGTVMSITHTRVPRAIGVS